MVLEPGEGTAKHRGPAGFRRITLVVSEGRPLGGVEARRRTWRAGRLGHPGSLIGEVPREPWAEAVGAQRWWDRGFLPKRDGEPAA